MVFIYILVSWYFNNIYLIINNIFNEKWNEKF